MSTTASYNPTFSGGGAGHAPLPAGPPPAYPAAQPGSQGLYPPSGSSSGAGPAYPQAAPGSQPANLPVAAMPLSQPGGSAPAQQPYKNPYLA